MYNLIEYNRNYSETIWGLWNCYWDEPNSGGAVRDINYCIKDSKSFHYKKSITGKFEDNSRTKLLKLFYH